MKKSLALHLFNTALSTAITFAALGCERPTPPGATPEQSPAGAAPSPTEAAAALATAQRPPASSPPAGEANSPTADQPLPATANAPSDAESESADPQVKRLVIASAVKDREPEPLTTGRPREPVVAFVELSNPAATDASIVVTFEHESGQKVGFIELGVPSAQARYRTWGRTHNIQRVGKWTAVVSSKNGKELAREEFDVLAAEGARDGAPAGAAEGDPSAAGTPD